MNISIIIPSSRPHTLAHVLNHINNQDCDIKYEVIIVQEAIDFTNYMHLQYNNCKIFRQRPHHDCGALARDRGLMMSCGQYVAFWDDDNVYYSNAIKSIWNASKGYDVGIVRTHHNNIIIPSGHKIIPGDIDTMCLCVKRSIALKTKWADGMGRYNDYRWISSIINMTTNINYSSEIIGRHI